MIFYLYSICFDLLITGTLYKLQMQELHFQDFPSKPGCHHLPKQTLSFMTFGCFIPVKNSPEWSYQLGTADAVGEMVRG